MSQERKPRMTIDEIEAAALELPDAERDELIERLRGGHTRRDVIRQAWLTEAERRMELVRAGKMRLIDADEVLEDQAEGVIARDLAAVAMQVPVDARAELADRLIASLIGDGGHDPAWAAEMNHRIGEIEAGTAKTLSEEEFFEKLKARRAARPVS